MTSFVASPASRAARAARYSHGAPRYIGHIRRVLNTRIHSMIYPNPLLHSRTLEGNDKLDTLQAVDAVEPDIAALKKATLADAGPILLHLLESFEFREYAMENGIRPAGIPDCIYTYVYNGVLIVDTPTRPASPIPDTDASNWMQREGYEGHEENEGSSPGSTQSTLCGNSNSSSDGGSSDIEMDMVAYVRGFATSKSFCKVSDPLVLFA